jgi:hypothetical protein
MNDEVALFTFGTLMDVDLLGLVCQQPIETLQLETAAVRDFDRRWVRDDHYPVLVALPGSSTQGLIIRGLEQESMDRIVFFEGEEFTLRNMMVERVDGQLEEVRYFASNERRPVSDQTWHLEEWQRSAKPAMLPRVISYMQYYGVMSIEEADAHWRASYI